MFLDWLTSGYRALRLAIKSRSGIDLNKRGAVCTSSNSKKRLALSIVAGGDGTQNTTPPADDPGFANVGIRGSGSGIYLGNGWVLTAAHVGAGSVWFGNTLYSAVANSTVQLTNPPNQAFTPNTDLVLYQIDGRPNLPSLSIESAAPAVGWNVIMAGNGRDRDASESYWTSSWTASSTPSTYAGYIWAGTQNIRWGTNVISLVGIPEGVGVNSETAFSTQFTGNTQYDAQGASGDSGGAVFHKDASGQWELTGVMFAISNLIGQPLGTSVFGDTTYSADLSVYRDQILSIIDAVNQAPTGANNTITTLENTSYTFATSDFGFSDPNNSPPNNFLAVKISTLPAAGTLTDNGVAVAAGQFIAVTDITAGLVKFTPAANASGTAYTSFTFQVEDDGGTANGGANLDPSPKTMTVNVTWVNQAPTGTSKTINALENTAYTFATSDFGFSDPNNSPPNNFLAVKISSLPAAGTLTDNGVAVAAGQFVAVSDITGGKLKFTPAAGASGIAYTNFTFQVEDDGGTANGGANLDPTPKAMTVNVTWVNQAPTGTSKTINTLENTAYTFATSDFGFSDPNNSPPNNFLAVKISTLPAAGTLTDNGVAVAAGQFVAVSDITGGKLKFTPAAGASGIAYTGFTFQVEDDGGTANGGANLDPSPKTMTVNVTWVNQAPTGTSKTINTLENTPYTFATADFGFSDANDTPPNNFLAVKISTLPAAGTLSDNGVAVTAGQFVAVSDITAGKLKFTPAANASGAPYTSFTFQVEDDGGTANGGANLDATPKTMTVNVTWVNQAPTGTSKTINTLENTAYTFATADFGFSDLNDTPPNNFLAVKITTLPAAGSLADNGVAVTASQFVSDSDITAGLLRFTPAANASGTAYTSFTFQVEDDGGTANGGMNLDPTPKTMTVNVIWVNNAPTGTSKTVSTLENSAYAFSTGDFGFSDTNNSPPNNFLAVKITTLPAAGTLSDNGVAVTLGQLVSVTDISGSKLKFNPAANASGAPYTSFTFQVEDDGGTANGGANLDPSPKIMTVNVTWVNQAPTGTSKTISTLENTAYTFATSDFGFSDPNNSPPDNLLAVKITTLPAAGTLSDNGAAVTAGQFIAVADISGAKLKFTPAANGSGAPYTSFTFQVEDDGGTAGGGVNLDPNPKTMTINVTPVDTTPPTVTGFTPAGGATGVAISSLLTVTFSEALNPSTVNTNTVQLMNGSSAVAASVSYNAGSNSVTLTPTAALANSTSYTVVVVGGASGIKDLAGNALVANASSSFTTVPAAPTTYSLWNASATPAMPDGGDGQAVELGVKFTPSSSGFITGVRFYKSTANTGVHTGSLWSASGQLLATATFTGEGGSGWQQVLFSTPVAVSAGTTYTASYHTNTGHYALNRSFFTSSFLSGPLQVPINGGVYLYGAGGFPTQSYQGSNYWVDVLFSTTPPVDTTPPTVTGFTPASGATGVAINSSVTVTFSEALNPSTVNTNTVQLMNGSTPVAASVSYNASTNTVTLTPTAALANSTSYTIVVVGGASGVKDLAGNALVANASSSFTTVPAAPTTYSLWNASATPAMPDSGDGQAVELGVKFTPSTSGFITGVRFYKSAANTGVHTGSLWMQVASSWPRPPLPAKGGAAGNRCCSPRPWPCRPARPTWPVTTPIRATTRSTAPSSPHRSSVDRCRCQSTAASTYTAQADSPRSPIRVPTTGSTWSSPQRPLSTRHRRR